jgi:methylmalonyl-CoA epimerase
MEDKMANVKRIDHVAIAVSNSEEAVQKYVSLFGAEHIKTEILEEKAGPVKVAYMRVGENILSLIQDMKEDGFLNKHIAKRGEGMHHLALEVDDLDDFVANAESQGHTIPLRDEFSNRREVVLRPKDTCGVIMQILEWTQDNGDTIRDRIKRILNLENL